MKTNSLSNAILLFIVLNVCLISKPVRASDLGVMGETYSILEIDFMKFIQLRVSELQQNGRWQLIENGMRQKANAYRIRPTPVAGITKAIESRTFLFDPSIVLDKNVISPDGRLIAVAGTRVNPLLHMRLSKTLIFFDADDIEQVKWVTAQEKVLQGRTKLILVNGSLLEQEKVFKKPVYFDQAGQLTNRFGIHHVPALVSQQGDKLSITEAKV